MRAYQVAIAGLLTFFITLPAASHPGRTNNSGCHNNRATGDYHCHNSGSSGSGLSSPGSTPSSPGLPLNSPGNVIELPTSTSTPTNFEAVTVVSVGDGDTFRANKQGQTITVRLACIDAPEMAQAPYGANAAQRLKQLLPVGQTISLKVVDRDRYGRSVAEVYTGNLSVNFQMVAEGQAVVYRQYLNSCPTMRNQLLQAETQAKQQRLAFWNQARPIMPYDFRRQ